MARARKDASRSLKVPGLLAIDFHRSTDACRAINLGLWSSFEHFVALTKQPGFGDKVEYFRGLADFQPDYFDVVAVKVGHAG